MLSNTWTIRTAFAPCVFTPVFTEGWPRLPNELQRDILLSVIESCLPAANVEVTGHYKTCLILEPGSRKVEVHDCVSMGSSVPIREKGRKYQMRLNEEKILEFVNVHRAVMMLACVVEVKKRCKAVEAALSAEEEDNSTFEVTAKRVRRRNLVAQIEWLERLQKLLRGENEEASDSRDPDLEFMPEEGRRLQHSRKATYSQRIPGLRYHAG